MKLLSTRNVDTSPADSPKNKGKDAKAKPASTKNSKASPKAAKAMPSPSRRVTGIEQRLKAAVASHPQQTSRGKDIGPLTHDFDRLLKTLRELITVARKYRQAMLDLGSIRSEVSDSLELFRR